MPKPFRVCLMPGHGGEDSGACDNGLKEKTVNANHAWAVAQELLARGYMVSTAPQETNGEKTPNSDRVEFANDHDAVALALHINAGGGRYALVEYAADNAQSKRLAEKICERYRTLFGPIISDSRVNVIEKGERGYVCVGGAKHSAVICEPLFIDNAEHAAWLKVRTNRVAWAKAVADAVDDLAASL